MIFRYVVFAIFLVLIFGCSGEDDSNNDEIIEINLLLNKENNQEFSDLIKIKVDLVSFNSEGQNTVIVSDTKIIFTEDTTFVLEYNAAKIDESLEYEIVANVLFLDSKSNFDGEYIYTRSQPVLTRGNGRELNISLDYKKISNSFRELESYMLDEFTFSKDIVYFELRMRESSAVSLEDDHESYNTMFSYGEEPMAECYFDNTSNDPRMSDLFSFPCTKLSSVSVSEGFFNGCNVGLSAGNCPAFTVTWDNEETAVQKTLEELNILFEDIDTIAEVHIWLWANKYNPETYKIVEDGYEVYASKRCDGDFIIFLHKDGSIDINETLSTQTCNNIIL